MSKFENGIKQVGVTELKEMLLAPIGNRLIIDVREPFEYENGHIPGVPLLPMKKIPLIIDGFDKEKEYVFVCRSGNRSQQVSLFLKANGIEKVVNYEGGMLQWDGELFFGPEHEVKSSEDLKNWDNN